MDASASIYQTRNKPVTILELGKKECKFVDKIRLIFKNREGKDEFYFDKGKGILLQRVEQAPDLEHDGFLKMKIKQFINLIIRKDDQVPNLNMVKHYYAGRDLLIQKADQNLWLQNYDILKADYSRENVNKIIKLAALNNHYENLPPIAQSNFDLILNINHVDINKAFPMAYYSTLEVIKKQPPANLEALFAVLKLLNTDEKQAEARLFLEFLRLNPDLSVFPEDRENLEPFIAGLSDNLELWQSNLAAYRKAGVYEAFKTSAFLPAETDAEKLYPLTHHIQVFNQRGLNDYIDPLRKEYGSVFGDMIRGQFALDHDLYYKEKEENFEQAASQRQRLQTYKNAGVLDRFEAFMESHPMNFNDAVRVFNRLAWKEVADAALQEWPQLKPALDHYSARLNDGEHHPLEFPEYSQAFKLLSLLTESSSALKESNEIDSIKEGLSKIQDLTQLPQILPKDLLNLHPHFERYGQGREFADLFVSQLKDDSTDVARYQEGFKTLDKMGQNFQALGLEKYYDQKMKVRLNAAGQDDFLTRLQSAAAFVEEENFKGEVETLTALKASYQERGLEEDFYAVISDIEKKGLTSQSLEETRIILLHAEREKFIEKLTAPIKYPALKAQIVDRLIQFEGGLKNIEDEFKRLTTRLPEFEQLYESTVGSDKLTKEEFNQVVDSAIINENRTIVFILDALDSLRAKFVEKQIQEGWGSSGIYRDCVTQYFKEYEPRILAGQDPIEESEFFKMTPQEQFQYMLPKIFPRFKNVSTDLVYDLLIRDDPKFPDNRVLEARMQELAKLNKLASDFREKYGAPIEQSKRYQYFIRILASPYLVDCMSEEVHTGRIFRLFDAYRDFINNFSYYPREAVAESVRDLLDARQKMEPTRRPKEILNEVAPGMWELTNVFNAENQNQLKRFSFLRSVHRISQKFIESKGISYTDGQRKIVDRHLSHFKLEDVNQESWPFVKNVILMALELGLEYDPAEIEHFLTTDTNIRNLNLSKNTEELKKEIQEKLELHREHGSNLVTRLQTDPVSAIRGPLMAAIGPFLPEKKREEEQKKFGEALDKLRTPFENSKLIQMALDAASPGAPFIHLIAKMTAPASENINELVDNVGLSIVRDLNKFRAAQITKVPPKKNSLSFVSTWIGQALVDQIKLARYVPLHEESTPLHEFLVEGLPPLIKKLEMANVFLEIGKKAKIFNIANWLLSTSAVKYGMKQVIHYALNAEFENKGIDKGEREVILASADIAVDTLAPLMEGILNKVDMKPYLVQLKKINDLIQSDEEPSDVDLNIACLEFFQQIYYDLEPYRPVVIETLKAISQVEERPVGEAA